MSGCQHEWQLQQTYKQAGGISPQTTEIWNCRRCMAVTQEQYVTDYTDPNNPVRRDITPI